jgi:chaperonin GroEL
LRAPAYWIAANGGKEGSVVVNSIAELPVGQGYDAAADEFVDLIAAGIIDPVKVTKSAVANAASIAGMVLTTASTVTDIPEEQAAPAGNGGHGHQH